jgi:transglutaminase/protease-like cytokinesis protein 3
MKFILSIIFLLGFSFGALTQNSISGKKISDEAIAPALLAQQLTLPYTTEKEKVESIFRWITDNISYQSNSPIIRSKQNRKPLEDDDTSMVLKPLNERVAENVLRRREAVCDGYARLFKTLCDFAGIQSELVTGYATGYRTTIFRSNHTWNAVSIDSKWYLLDATWASGYINYRGEYVKSYDARYFLTPPHLFIKDHYPEDMKWSLMSNNYVPVEFKKSPFRHQGMDRNKIQSFSPLAGVIEANTGDSIQIELETPIAKKDVFVSADPYYEIVFLPSLNIHFKNSSTTRVKGNRVFIKYIIPSYARDWIYIIMNGEILMRYRLKPKEIAETEPYMIVNSASAN